ncbi:hypothetical protein FIV31_03605 [Coxiella endosymbiont of Ornithodoros amblus]|nr:hypothetical protein [Coxiella endosymbiont of Ornithodoros amblus]
MTISLPIAHSYFNFRLRRSWNFCHPRAGGNPGAPEVRCACVRWVPACRGDDGLFLVLAAACG